MPSAEPVFRNGAPLWINGAPAWSDAPCRCCSESLCQCSCSTLELTGAVATVTVSGLSTVTCGCINPDLYERTIYWGTFNGSYIRLPHTSGQLMWATYNNYSNPGHLWMRTTIRNSITGATAVEERFTYGCQVNWGCTTDPGLIFQIAFFTNVFWDGVAGNPAWYGLCGDQGPFNGSCGTLWNLACASDTTPPTASYSGDILTCNDLSGDDQFVSYTITGVLTCDECICPE